MARRRGSLAYEVGDLIVIRDGPGVVIAEVTGLRPTMATFERKTVEVPPLNGYVVRRDQLLIKTSLSLFPGRRFSSLAACAEFLDQYRDRSVCVPNPMVRHLLNKAPGRPGRKPRGTDA